MGEYYSQHGEDRWIAEHFEELGLPEQGVFVEFGAADGETISNTCWLERIKKWSGLLCEPDMRHQIKDRPRSIIERCVVGPAGIVRFGVTDDPYLGGIMRTEQECTLPAESVLIVRHVVERPSIPLSLLLDQHNMDHVDLVSIDTEGSELEAWRTLDLARWRPTVAILELWTWGLPRRDQEMIDAMAADGYEMRHRTECNGIFVNVR